MVYNPNFRGFLETLTPAYFAPVMGLAGLGIAWRIAAPTLGMPSLVGEIFVSISFVVFVLVSLASCAKAAVFPKTLVQDFIDNRRLVFFPLIPTSGLLLSIGIRPYSIETAVVLWWVSAVPSFYFSVLLTGRWLFGHHDALDLSPAWLFPIVGNGVVPIAGVPLGFVQSGWMFFMIGFVMWIFLFAGMFHRLVFEDRLSEHAMPSVLILMSPPATFFIAYYELTDGVISPMLYAMIYTSLFLFAVFMLNIEKLIRAPVSITTWSFTFPMAALTIATQLFYRSTRWPGFFWLALILLGITTLAVAFAFTSNAAVLAIKGAKMRSSVKL